VVPEPVVALLPVELSSVDLLPAFDDFPLLDCDDAELALEPSVASLLPLAVSPLLSLDAAGGLLFELFAGGGGLFADEAFDGGGWLLLAGGVLLLAGCCGGGSCAGGGWLFAAFAAARLLSTIAPKLSDACVGCGRTGLVGALG
jgi:hypothetical protein